MSGGEILHEVSKPVPPRARDPGASLPVLAGNRFVTLGLILLIACCLPNAMGMALRVIKGAYRSVKILAIDTATPAGSIALVEGGLLKAQHVLNVNRTHNRRLLVGIDRILSECRWTLEELDAFAVSLGPGSFTGLRIGLSVMKGLAWSTGKPMAGVSTLDVLAGNVSFVDHLICPVLDARKGEIYTALYRSGDQQEPERLTPYMALQPEELVELIAEKTVLVGDALLRYSGFLSSELGDLLVETPPHLNMVHASCVAWLAGRRLRQGMVEDISSCTPLYVRPSEAELNRMAE
ncbi:MAG: tRNA (adenosine(37)-N6)-threonylcarbamoyltransferase complex dimerization subunit type 1 TsaB [Deltaproteobacteria bacterium]|nr:MAG: tRNA (adenosine(37)-N6)-threonylcarbamoyltransferase complex dimerization subunit type 1 TsaB [Deltaproteobacteria bacterium]